MAQDMNPVPKIRKLDQIVVNRIAAGEVIQRPANALKELIENSLDAKATNIQILTKEGGLKLLQIQDNGTGIRKDDMEIVCERFTTSKLQKFEDLSSIATFGFRGEALASISHVALLTITTKTADEKCAYKASYIDSKLKAPPKSCAGNQGTTITIENLFYNVATRRKALSSPAEEFAKITDVVMKYAVHNPSVGFVLKKHGEMTPQIRTPHNSTKMNNARILYGNPVSRELLEVELDDESYKFKLHALITNPNYSNKRMVILLFINNRLVDSSNIRKMLEELYSLYLPKKAHPWCYISLHINPANIDVNVHPTKHEVKFLHEDTIIERVKSALDEKLSSNSASRTFYLQARLPNADITKEVLEEVLPEYDKSNLDKSKKVYAHQMIRTDSADQKLDKFNFTIHSAMKLARNDDEVNATLTNQANETDKISRTIPNKEVNDTHQPENVLEVLEEPGTSQSSAHWSDLMNDSNSSLSETVEPVASEFVTSTQDDKLSQALEAETVQEFLDNIRSEFGEKSADIPAQEKCVDDIADEARKKVYKYFGRKDSDDISEKSIKVIIESNEESDRSQEDKAKCTQDTTKSDNSSEGSQSSSSGFKSYSVNKFRREVKLKSVLNLRKEVEKDCHEGLRQILTELTFVGCVDDTRALIQSGVNLYLCNTKKLAEEFFYEVMLYDFANYGIIKFSNAVPLYELALLGLDMKEVGWTEEDGDKTELATNVKELLLEKADMMKEYFSIVIDKKGNLKSLPILLDKYFPFEGGLPLYILRLATEVDWSTEQPCFQNICRETARFYSEMNPVHNTHDWKYITEHVLYPAIKDSLLPPKHFAHDSTILKIASLPELYKVFERC